MELLIGERIKQYRKERDITQDALATVLGVSPQSISKWERGDGYPDITLLPSIANYFEVTVDDLIGNDRISVEEDVQKNYFGMEGKLDHEARLQLALTYHKKYPRNWHIATSLMYEISRHHRKKLEQYQPFLYELCERILRECPDSVMRRDAIRSICMVCAEEEINDWLNKDTTFWYKERHKVFEERYRLMRDREQYEAYQFAGAYLQVSQALYAIKRDRNYRNQPQKAVLWNQTYLKMLDAAAGHAEETALPTGWIAEYASAYLRLAAAYFGAKDRNKGYQCLELALELTKQYYALPTSTPLELGNPVLFGQTKALKMDDLLLLPNGKTLQNSEGVDQFSPCMAAIMEATKGWEWFNDVRTEERFLQILEQAKALEE
ncbi:MAG: helix-turn-helix transcriptional regulator [Clostridia bacterium]|nr:helix-turn-helix transcriptional regulator [Clostridia bacterium]